MFTIHRQCFRDDREILVSNDTPLAISRGVKMSVISGNVSKLLSGKPHQNIVAVNNAKSLQIVYDFDLAILRAEMQHATVGSKCSTV